MEQRLTLPIHERKHAQPERLREIKAIVEHRNCAFFRRRATPARPRSCNVTAYKPTNYPFASGADRNAQYFSGNVEEKRDGEGGATYWLKA